MKNNGKRVIPAVIIAVLALTAAAGSRSFLGPCVHEDGTFGSCHWAGQAVSGIAAVLLLEGAAAAFLKKAGAARGLFLSIFLTGVLGILIPGPLIRLCGMATMRCNAVMRPAMTILFGAISAAAAAGFLLNGEKS